VGIYLRTKKHDKMAKKTAKESTLDESVLKIFYRNIAEIKPNPKNPRVIRDEKFKKLVASLTEFPQMLEKRPLVCFTDNADGKLVVLGGNMRLRAAQEIGIKELPVMLADDWTAEQHAEFLIKDNVGFGEWNWEELANEWDSDKLDAWGLNLPNYDTIDSYLDVDDNKDINDNINQPKATDDDYSTFDLVMLHENKLILLETLNQIKRNFLFEKIEDALMELVRNYNK